MTELHQFTPFTIAVMIREYAAGVSTYELARRNQVSQSTMRRHLRLNGVTLRPRGARYTGTPVNPTEWMRRKMRRMG